ncbi:P-type conjugative transfer protein TrbL (plasmid) [Phenylobacterium sp. LH3H17]|uniref:P-type conjugative transfer protein TrbL n=1 Tax=Phenylobacterium sp. LH3H17 TaxID=2903901 RepID=UPI0020C984E8|nr:P-type conjugative transfer protein TrbL [Phenylobacterium sp. LH3H17]UTP41740.1 P-type conjugative transfer protein TrbL [Phenylobacterium sp. LH3H17]
MMATADPAALDDFLNRFRSQVDAGFGLIQGDVAGTLAALVVISITITALLWAIDENQNVLASLVRKVLLVGFFAFLVTQWASLTKTVVNGFAALGLKAGGGAMSLADFTTSPSKIVISGIEVVKGLMLYVKEVAPGPIEFFAHIDVVLMALVAAIGILIAFVILAIEIVVTIIEFHIVTLIAFVTVPFGVLTQTSFMSERAIGYVISVGIKLMALAIVVSLGTTVFDSYTVSAAPDINEDVGLLLGAVVMVMLALKIPAIAGALISGGPQLNAGGALMGAAGVAAGVAGVGLAARMAGGAIAQGAAAGGAKVAAARAASGGLSSGGGAPGGGGGGGPSPPASPGPAPTPSPAPASHSAPAPVSGGPSASKPEAPASDAGSTSPIVARARARRSGLGSAARTSAASAAASGDSNSPGMSASPIRPDDDPKS